MLQKDSTTTMTSPLKQLLVLFLLGFQLSLIPNEASANPSKPPQSICQHILTQAGRLKSATTDWMKDVRNTRGANLLVTKADSDPISRPYLGFLTRNEDYWSDSQIWRRLQAIYQFIPRRMIGFLRAPSNEKWGACKNGDSEFNLTLGQGIQTCLIDIPISQLGKLKGQQLRPTLLLSLSLWLPIGYTAVTLPLETFNKTIVSESERKNIFENFDQLTFLLTHDPRFEGLKQKWDQEIELKKDRIHQLDSSELEIFEQILGMVQLISLSHQSFLSSFDPSAWAATEEHVNKLIRYPQFAHLSLYADPQIFKNEAHYKKAWQDLVWAHWLFHHMIEITPDLYFNPQLYNEMEKWPPNLQSLIESQIKEFSTRSFYIQLREQVSSGKISESEARSLIQYLVYYRFRLLDMDLLNQSLKTPLKLSEDFSWEKLEQELIVSGVTQKEQFQLIIPPGLRPSTH